MKSILMLMGFLASSMVFACEPIAEGICKYEKHGFHFEYLSRWEVVEESGWFSSPYVFLETQDSGIIMVMVFNNDESEPLNQFAEKYSDEANSQMLFGSLESIKFEPLKSSEKHQGIQEHLMMDIFDMKSPMTRQYYSINSDEYTAFLIIQLDNEELGDISGLEIVLNTFEFIEKHDPK